MAVSYPSALLFVASYSCSQGSFFQGANDGFITRSPKRRLGTKIASPVSVASHELMAKTTVAVRNTMFTSAKIIDSFFFLLYTAVQK